jgi:hypothetical protein
MHQSRLFGALSESIYVQPYKYSGSRWRRNEPVEDRYFDTSPKPLQHQSVTGATYTLHSGIYAHSQFPPYSGI